MTDHPTTIIRSYGLEISSQAYIFHMQVGIENSTYRFTSLVPPIYIHFGGLVTYNVPKIDIYVYIHVYIHILNVISEFYVYVSTGSPFCLKNQLYMKLKCSYTRPPFQKYISGCVHDTS